MKNIKESKKALEALIISNEFVTSISTRTRGSGDYIEVGVAAEKNVAAVQSHLDAGKWEGFPVEVIVEPPSTPL